MYVCMYVCMYAYLVSDFARSYLSKYVSEPYVGVRWNWEKESYPMVFGRVRVSISEKLVGIIKEGMGSIEQYIIAVKDRPRTTINLKYKCYLYRFFCFNWWKYLSTFRIIWMS